MEIAMNKKEWLSKIVWVDLYGRELNLSDAPMTHMSREQSLLRRGHTKEQINKMWELGKQ